ncbi:MAG: hypothetical protein IPN72_24395 [Saprospiraceae bacterium]|nr:hypothetical protein [Saprospiraceae bacterium]
MDELVEEHELDNAVINILGLGLLPTYQFLFEQKPSLEDFEKWVLEKEEASFQMK